MATPRRREGLEGLPVNSDEVVMMDGVRNFHASDRAALLVVWLGVLGAAVLAFFGRAPGLALVALVGAAVAAYWTVGVLRSARGR